MKNIYYLLIFLSLAFGFLSCGNNIDKDSDKLQGDLIIFHAGSLAVPFKLIAQDFERENPGVNILLEAAGSVACARKITDLNKECDILASADFQIINRLLIPKYADWNISFAANELVIAYTDYSILGQEINSENWTEILADPRVIFGRSNPNLDPCGYRSVMTTQLMALKENNPEIIRILEKDKNYIRPKEVDLLGLLEAKAIDYIFIYRSVAQQHHLNILSLNDSVNLANPDLTEWYANAHVQVAGNEPGQFIDLVGGPMVYGLTQLKNAPNPAVAQAFLEFFFEETKGMKIIIDQGQSSIIPAISNTYSLIPHVLQRYAKDLIVKP